MTSSMLIAFVLIIATCTSLAPGGGGGGGQFGAEASATGGRKNLVCYFGSWSGYRPDAGKFTVDNIDPFLCTHLVYGFTGLSQDNTIKPLDAWNDLEEDFGKGAFKKFTSLKKVNPDLKTLIAIGGWNEGSAGYSRMTNDPGARATFIKSVMNFLDKYNFDGLDLDWEYPAQRGGAPSDRENLVHLLRELREAFRPRGYLLTAAVPAGKSRIDPSYDIAQVAPHLDLINLMAYDYHGGWEQKTGMNAPLFGSARNDFGGEAATLNVNWSVNYWLAQGAPREKLMLGVGSYGRSWTLDNAQVNGPNAPAGQSGQAGPYTREPGSLGYNELCEYFKRSPASWTIVRDPDYLAPYAYNNERQWVSYDDQESLRLKAEFAKSMGLGGMMMWSIETDDFRGVCHGEKFPLLNTIRRVMDGDGGGGGGGGEENARPQEPSPRPHQPHPTPSSSSSGGSSSSTSAPNSEVTVRPSISSQQESTCRGAGMFTDPQNCRKFIRCVPLGFGWQTFKFDCGPGTAFNEQQGYCDHIYNVPNCSRV